MGGEPGFNLADLFELVADDVPERVAIAVEGRHLTYAGLEERANRLAHFLSGRGVGPGDHVGLQLHNGAEYIEGMLAAYKIRAVPVNVNYRYVEAELRYLYDDSDAKALVHDRSLAHRVRGAAEGLALPATFLTVDGPPLHDHEIEPAAVANLALGAVPYEEALAASSPQRDFGPRSPDDLYIVYTGGTTGKPKGVMWRQEDVYFAAMGGGNPGGAGVDRPEDVLKRVAEDPMRVFPAAPLVHNSAQWVAWMFLTTGGTVVLCPDRSFDPIRIWRIVEQEQVQSLAVVGDAMARPLVDALDDPDADFDLSSLFVFGSGGAVLSPHMKQRLHERIPNLLVMDACGSSETGQQGARPSMPGAEVGEGAVFEPQEGTAVLDENLRPVAPGSGKVGLLARSGHVPLGYYKDPEKTVRTFPVVDGVRWAVPGDAATLEADGAIVLLGRGSQCITTGGEKVFPEEVETVLTSHPDVYDALVVGVADPRWGQTVAALVQPVPGRTFDATVLQEHCRGHLARYKVPKEVHAVERVARSAAGKADYKWAAAYAADHARA